MLTLDMKNRTVMITGGTGLLGRELAMIFAECNADVIIHYNKNEMKAKEIEKAIKNMGKNAFVVQGDITKEESVQDMHKNIKENFKMPNIIVNNAIIQYTWKEVLDQEISDYYSQFESCVMQMVYMTKNFAPYMKDNRWGRIICINSECAATAEVRFSAYTSAKKGLDGIVKVLAKELGPFGITVNQVAPGRLVHDKETESDKLLQKEYELSVPLKRRGTVDEVANMVVFLSSDLASFTTGAYIPVCGGRTMLGI